jgi:hypothetical protein
MCARRGVREVKKDKWKPLELFVGPKSSRRPPVWQAALADEAITRNPGDCRVAQLITVRWNAALFGGFFAMNGGQSQPIA